MIQGLRHGPPARAIGVERAERIARPCFQFIGFNDAQGGHAQGNGVGAGQPVHGLKRGRADPARRHVDDPFERQIVIRLMDQPHIGDGVANFLAFVKSRAADHAIGQTEGDKALFELTHLETGPDQYRHFLQADLVALQRFDRLAHHAGFGFPIPDASDRDRVAAFLLGP